MSSSVDTNIYVLDEEDNDSHMQLMSIGLKCSMLSSHVVWLDSAQEYLTTESDKSCINGKYVKLNSVCWFQTGWYSFPPKESNLSVVPPGQYYLVQRVRNSGRYHNFPGKIEFQLRGRYAGQEECFNIKTLFFEINRLSRMSREWKLITVGQFCVAEPCEVQLRLEEIKNGQWKSGYCWDYFELMAVSQPPFKLKKYSCSTIVKTLTSKSSDSIQNLSLPNMLKTYLITYLNAPDGKLCMFENMVKSREGAYVNNESDSDDEGWDDYENESFSDDQGWDDDENESERESDS